MLGGSRPLPVAILREKLHHNAEATMVGQFEGLIPTLSRPRPPGNDQQKAAGDCREKLTHCTLHFQLPTRARVARPSARQMNLPRARNRLQQTRVQSAGYATPLLAIDLD